MKNAEAVASNFFLDPRRFWKEFKDAPEKCPISDVTKWTHCFKGLVGTPGSDPDALNDDAGSINCLISSMEVSEIRIGYDLRV